MRIDDIIENIYSRVMIRIINNNTKLSTFIAARGLKRMTAERNNASASTCDASVRDQQLDHHACACLEAAPEVPIFAHQN